MGDLNGHNPILGSNRTNRMGQIIENLLNQNELCFLDDGTGTRFNTNETSCPDISLFSPELDVKLEWSVLEDGFGSDHFPIVVKDIIPVNIQRIKRFALQRADWTLFQQLAISANTPDDSIDEMLNTFESTISNAALEAIPCTTGGVGRIPVPWWNEDCKYTRRQKKIAQRRYHRNPTIENKIDLNQARANARRVQ